MSSSAPALLPRRPAFFLHLLLAWVAVALVACGGGGGGPDEPPGEPVGRVVQGEIASTNTRSSFTISVYLPESYDGGTRSYPVIYAIEGDARFGYGPLRSDTRFEAFKQAMQRRGTEAILVGISGVARRDIDFLLPTATRYHDFLVEELVPRIERQYRADPARRALTGLSHGGHFVNIALFLEGTSGELTFSHFLSTETSSGNVDHATFLAREQAMFEAGRPLPTTVLLAGGAAGQTNAELVDALYRQMRAHDYQGLTLLKADFATSHVGADVPAFEEALRRFFP